MYRLRTTKRIFIHPSAIVKCSTKLEVGKNFSIAKNCYIDALSKNGIVLGANVSIGKYTTIECTGSLKNVGTGLMIGNNVGLGTHGFWGCAGGISVGNDCIFGNFVSLHSENHNYVDINIPIRLQGVNRKGIIIGNNCWIGAKVTILDGSIIGDGCVIAAGTVVRGTFPNNCIIGGVPSKILKYRTT
jgi:acetyltransferase-like isoleucine patch superfamily enzyme